MWQPSWQEIAVAVIVLLAFAVSAWKLMPARRRLRILLSIDGWAARRARFAAIRTRVLQPRIQRAGGGCGDCAANPAARAPQRPR
jgi:hypothetical protein